MAYTLITGATGGIGKAFAIECAKSGYDLFLTGRSNIKLSDLKAELTELNQFINIITFPCDLTDEADRQALLNKADEKDIKFERLINVAGVDIQKGFLDYSIEKVLMQLRVNVEATITLTHSFLNRTSADVKLPEIITVSSMSGVSPMPYFALYSATKACLTNFYKALRCELKGKAKITTVLPGGVYTRPDICEDIEGQGLWGKLSAKTPDVIAVKSLKAVRRNKKILIPGFWNKFLYFILKITPEDISLKFIKNRWKKQSKDAF